MYTYMYIYIYIHTYIYIHIIYLWIYSHVFLWFWAWIFWLAQAMLSPWHLHLLSWKLWHKFSVLPASFSLHVADYRALLFWRSLCKPANIFSWQRSGFKVAMEPWWVWRCLTNDLPRSVATFALCLGIQRRMQFGTCLRSLASSIKRNFPATNFFVAGACLHLMCNMWRMPTLFSIIHREAWWGSRILTFCVPWLCNSLTNMSMLQELFGIKRS